MLMLTQREIPRNQILSEEQGQNESFMIFNSFNKGNEEKVTVFRRSVQLGKNKSA